MSWVVENIADDSRKLSSDNSIPYKLCALYIVFMLIANFIIIEIYLRTRHVTILLFLIDTLRLLL